MSETGSEGRPLVPPLEEHHGQYQGPEGPVTWTYFVSKLGDQVPQFDETVASVREVGQHAVQVAVSPDGTIVWSNEAPQKNFLRAEGHPLPVAHIEIGVRNVYDDKSNSRTPHRFIEATTTTGSRQALELSLRDFIIPNLPSDGNTLLVATAYDPKTQEEKYQYDGRVADFTGKNKGKLPRI